MPNIGSMISAHRMICFMRYLSTNPAWLEVFFWTFILKKLGGGEEFLLQCNFNYARPPITLPEFFKDCIVTWSLLNEDNPSSSSERANQVIWNNQFICIESKSIYNCWLIDLEIVRIGDLNDTRAEFKSNKEPLYSTLSPVDIFLTFQSPQFFSRRMVQNIKNK